MQDTNCIAIGKGVGLSARLGVATGWGAQAGARVDAWARACAGVGGTGVRALGARGRAGQAGRRREARAGWPGLCTRCTPLGFQPGFSTRYFS